MIETFFDKLSKRAPFAIFKDRLYQLAIGIESSDTVSVGGLKIGLIPSSDLGELEALDRDMNAKVIFDYKKEFIEQQLRLEMKTAESMARYTGENELLRFLLNELFPMFSDDKGEIAALLNGGEIKEEKTSKGIEQLIAEETQRQEVTALQITNLKQELIAKLEAQTKKQFGAQSERTLRRPAELDSETEDIAALLRTYYRKSGTPGTVIKLGQPKAEIDKEPARSSFGEIFADNIFVFRSTAYKLVPAMAKTTEGTIIVQIGKQEFNTLPLLDVTMVSAPYRAYLEQKFKMEAVNEFEGQLAEIQRIRARNKAIEKFSGRTELEAGDIGFVKKGDATYVYLKVPKFAMKHPKREDYYAFDACRVGLKVRYDGGKVHSDYDAVIVEEYSHPFLPRKMQPFQTICNMGHNIPDHRLSDAERIAKQLEDARNTFMHGLTLDSFASHGGTDIHDSSYYYEILKERLEGHTMTLSEAKKGGYKITNMLWKFVDGKRSRFRQDDYGDRW